MRISIVRPSAIEACAKEPFPGWMDQVGPAAAVFFPMGHGMSTTFLFHKKPCDIPQIPCDIVTNSILVIGMVTARLPEPQFNIFHCSSNEPAACANTYGFIKKA